MRGVDAPRHRRPIRLTKVVHKDEDDIGLCFLRNGIVHRQKPSKESRGQP
jgi:hypothetical protein